MEPTENQVKILRYLGTRSAPVWATTVWHGADTGMTQTGVTVELRKLVEAKLVAFETELVGQGYAKRFMLTVQGAAALASSPQPTEEGAS